MNKNTNLISFAAGAAVCATLGFGLGFTQPEKVKDKAAEKVKEKAAAPVQPAGEMDMEAMMAEMAAMSTPGAEHAHLAKSVGHWTASAEFVQPGEEPMKAAGSMDAKMALGGRFVIGEFRLPDFMGAPFEGMSIMGYDKYAGEYTSVWIDTMTTRITTMRGSMSEDGTLVMKGTSVTPMGEAPMKIESSMEGNTMTDRFFDGMPDGTWVQSGTITYTRGQSGKKGG